MKKIVSVFITFTLLFSLSLAPIFGVDWTTTDQTNLQNAANRLYYQGYGAARLLYDIRETLSTMNSTVTTIASRLTDGNHSIANLVSSISDYMNPIYLRLQDILRATSDPALNAISSLLGYPTTDSSTGVTSYTSYLRELWLGNTNTPITIYPLTLDSAQNIIFGTPYNVNNINTATQLQNYFLEWAIAHWNNRFQYYNERILSGETNTQTYTDPLTLSSSTFTPTSMTNGLYTWLSKIQNPVARLSYVLASDERIDAQEAAAANEDAIVDNFIDSSGSGAASPSDISSVSGLSSGFKDNISTDANVSGIWNIFNSDNFGWFSQETANQLDTTGGNRTLRSSGSYPTPLLDQQTEDIFKLIGGDDND